MARINTIPRKRVLILSEQLHVEWDTQFHRAAIKRMIREKLYEFLTQQTQVKDWYSEENLVGSSFEEISKSDEWDVGDVFFWLDQ